MFTNSIKCGSQKNQHPYLHTHKHVCIYLHVYILEKNAYIFEAFFCYSPIALVLEIPNHLKLIQSMWEDDHRLSTNAIQF